MTSVEVSRMEVRFAWTGWLVIGVIMALWLANESLPVVVGTGRNARWDWAFTYVTLRAFVLPSLSLFYAAGNVFLMVRKRKLSVQGVFRCCLAGLVIYFCWIFQEAIFAS